MDDNLSLYSSPQLKDIVQEMRDLLSQTKLSFLLGAGCSKVAGLPLMSELTEQVLSHEALGDETKKVLRIVKESFSGAGVATIEDYMSEIVDLLSIVERRIRRGASLCTVPIDDQQLGVHELQLALDEIKTVISSIIGNAKVDITTHQQFVSAVHGSLQAGKESRCVDYFILNYDTLIEDALGLERVIYNDGFRGSATGWWEPNTFKADRNISRIFKVHGSIDWCLLQGDSTPRRIRNGLKTEADTRHVLIYPAATKYQETQRDPFAQILQHMRDTLSPCERKEMVLVICGYSFGDSHIDLEIEKALLQSEGRLTLVAFISSGEPGGKLNDWISNPIISDQVRVYSSKGFFHGEKRVIEDSDLSWWRFEVLAQLLRGSR